MKKITWILLGVALFLGCYSITFASEQQCIGPITMSAVGSKRFDFGYQKSGNNEIFTVAVVKTTGTVSATVTASLEPYGCNGGTNAGAACTVDSQCPGGTCYQTAYKSSGDHTPVDRYTGTALAAITATGYQQFDGPWNFVSFNLGTCTLGTVSNGCSIVFNICGKDL